MSELFMSRADVRMVHLLETAKNPPIVEYDHVRPPLRSGGILGGCGDSKHFKYVYDHMTKSAIGLHGNGKEPNVFPITSAGGPPLTMDPNSPLSLWKPSRHLDVLDEVEEALGLGLEGIVDVAHWPCKMGLACMMTLPAYLDSVSAGKIFVQRHLKPKFGKVQVCCALMMYLPNGERIIKKFRTKAWMEWRAENSQVDIALPDPEYESYVQHSAGLRALREQYMQYKRAA